MDTYPTPAGRVEATNGRIVAAGGDGAQLGRHARGAMSSSAARGAHVPGGLRDRDLDVVDHLAAPRPFDPAYTGRTVRASGRSRSGNQ